MNHAIQIFLSKCIEDLPYFTLFQAAKAKLKYTNPVKDNTIHHSLPNVVIEVETDTQGKYQEAYVLYFDICLCCGGYLSLTYEPADQQLIFACTQKEGAVSCDRHVDHCNFATCPIKTAQHEIQLRQIWRITATLLFTLLKLDEHILLSGYLTDIARIKAIFDQETCHGFLFGHIPLQRADVMKAYVIGAEKEKIKAFLNQWKQKKKRKQILT